MDIHLYDTRSRGKVRLSPVSPGRVGMYVCGPTVYDRAHIGNARPVVVFDTLFRLLRQTYGAEAVTYVRNVTDVDDKINARAAQSGQTIREITEETLAWYHADMDALGALRPTIEPRATEYIGAMVAMIETLVARGHAYAAGGHVLFSVTSDAQYGTLARRTLEDMRAGARVEVAPYKRDPMDFVLWKPSTPELPGWGSPWGRGRPGWHIECSAMAHQLLGESFDIHGGGIDLAFPHHENEAAQSRCAHPTGDFARIWMHNGFLNVEGEKMSKSLGNFFTVRDLIDQGVPGRVVRFVLLSTHYRQPMDWTERKATETEERLRRWHAEIRFYVDPADIDETRVSPEILRALADDLNSPLAISLLDPAGARQRDPGARWLQLAHDLKFLGLLDEAALEVQGATWVDPMSRLEANVQARIQAIVDSRLAAKKLREFARADELRNQLVAAGVVVNDSRDGTSWELGPGFDPSKLEGLR
jgi:cysteinyl-tRNA synthetase